MKPMKLTERQRNDPLWVLLKKHLEERLAAHRVKNDVSTDLGKTEKLRGRIAELNYVLSLEQPEGLKQAPYIEE